MKIEKIPLTEINVLSKLMQDYIDEKPALKDLYKYKKTLSSFKEIISDKRKQNINREVLSNELKKQYANLEDTILVNKNIQLLKDEKTFTITTAHQLCLFTGPLYFIYKIISTIKLCKILKQEYPDFNFVPIFWMGSEDHDFEEINHLNIYDKKLEWERSEFGAVGKMRNTDIQKVIDELKNVLFKDENNKYIDKLDSIFNKDKNYANSFIKYIHYLFGKYGLVVLEQDNAKFKKLFSKQIKKELFENIVENTILKELHFLDKNYKIQAKPRSINIFYMKDGLRERIIKKDNKYFVNNSSICFNQKSLYEELKNFPERFSPNVLLRPLYQEFILPNLAYIGGGGELAYWLELQSLFHSQAINYPMLLLRDMSMIVSKKISKKLEKISFDKKSLFENKELLISNLTKTISSKELSLKNEEYILKKTFKTILKKALEIDNSLERNILSEEKKALNSIQNIELKMLRAEKRNNELLLSQISAIKDKLFPHSKLQERHDNFLPYFIKYDFDFFDFLIKHFNPLKNDFSIIIEE